MNRPNPEQAPSGARRRRVVVTGLGAVTAHGEGADALWNAFAEGRSAIDWMAFGDGGWKVPAAYFSGFAPEKFVSQRKSLKVMARDIQLAVAAASLAMQDARLSPGGYDPDGFGVLVGSGVLNHELDELAYSVRQSLDGSGKLDLQRFGQDGLSALFPLWLLKYLPNMPACHVSIAFDLRGMNNTLTTGGSAGLQAIGEAARIIERGTCDRMIAGGAESKVNPVGLSAYRAMGLLDEKVSDPKDAYRPFASDARGLVVGEASAFVVLEEYEAAKKRGATIVAEVAGYGAASARGIGGAMKRALADAGMTAKELSLVQACGLGLAAEDKLERDAINDVFNGSASSTWLTGSKPSTGFSGFSSGALDLLLAAQSLRLREVAPYANVAPGRSGLALRVAEKKTADPKLRAALVNSFGLGGQAVSMVLKAAEDPK